MEKGSDTKKDFLTSEDQTNGSTLPSYFVLMFKKIVKIYDTIKSNGFVALFGFLIILDNTYNFLTSYLISLYDEILLDIDPYFEGFSLMEIFFLTVIIAPLLETFVFQYLIVEILYKLNINDEIIIWVATLAFSLSHYYNFIYILAILFPGFLFSSFYLYLKKSKYKFPFLAVTVLHAISNFIVFIINDILNL